MFVTRKDATCDTCHHSFEFVVEVNDPNDQAEGETALTAELVALGWTTQPDGDDFKDTCPDCVAGHPPTPAGETPAWLATRLTAPI